METKKEVIQIVYDLLNRMEEGITDFVFHEIIKQTEDHLIVSVGYTWSLHGHKKPVAKMQRSFYKENGAWRILT